MTLESAITEWLAGERLGQHRHLLIEEIIRLAKHSDGAWPIAERYQWDRAIDACLAAGTIVERNGRLRMAPKPEEPQKDTDTQQELF